MGVQAKLLRHLRRIFRRRDRTTSPPCLTALAHLQSSYKFSGVLGPLQPRCTASAPFLQIHYFVFIRAAKWRLRRKPDPDILTERAISGGPTAGGETSSRERETSLYRQGCWPANRLPLENGVGYHIYPAPMCAHHA